jgi:hypothetical protein
LIVKYIKTKENLNEKFDHYNNLISKSISNINMPNNITFKDTGLPENTDFKDNKESVINSSEFASEAVNTIEITKSVVKLGNKLNTAKGALQKVGNAADSIIPFIPLIRTATSIINEVMSIYQQAEYNKKIIGALCDRTKLAEYAVDTLQRRKKFYENNFKRQEWYYAFNRFVNVLKDIKNFAKEISTIRGYLKYLKSYPIKDKFEELSVKYDNVMKDLNFTLAVSNEEQRRYDNICLLEDVAEMEKVSFYIFFYFI